MRYLEARNEAGDLKRASLANAAPWARSVVVCALNYNTDQPYSTHAGTTSQGWISRYAWTQRDYHDVVLAKLRQLETKLIASCEQERCRQSPHMVLRRYRPRHRAHLRQVRRHRMDRQEHLHPQSRAWIVAVSWRDAHIDSNWPPIFPPPDRCGSCTRCLDACPTNAFPAPYQLDATKCISYLTIEKRGAIPEDLRAGIGRQVFGCDICQDVCPWNRDAPLTNTPEFAARPQLVNPELEWLARLSLEEFREVFRGTPVKRAKYSGLLRNVAIAMGNSGEERFLAVLEELVTITTLPSPTPPTGRARRLIAPGGPDKSK